MSNLPEWAKGIEWPEGWGACFDTMARNSKDADGNSVRLSIDHHGILWVRDMTNRVPMKCKSRAHALKAATALIEAMEGGE